MAQGIFRPVDPKRMSIFISTFLDGCLFRNVMFPQFSYRRAMQDMRAFVLDHLRLPPAGSDDASSNAQRARRTKTKRRVG
jgi:hypothetical protein